MQLNARAILPLMLALCSQTLSAQGQACRDADLPIAPVAPTARWRWEVKAPLITHGDSLVVQSYERGLPTGLLTNLGVFTSFDPRKVTRVWHLIDVGLSTLLLGNTPPVTITAESIVWNADRLGGTLNVSVGCVRKTKRQAIGTYSLPYRIFQDTAWFKASVADFVQASVPVVVGNLNVYASEPGTIDTSQLRKDMEFLRISAEDVHLKVPERIDVVVTARSDSTLALFGINSFVTPIAQITFGDFVVSRPNAKGGVSHHELIHTLELGVAMHPYVAEGLAVFLGGSDGRSLVTGACEHRAELGKQTVTTLNALVDGDESSVPDEHVRALLNGFLGAILSQAPRVTWTLSRHMLSDSQMNEIVEAWNTLLHLTLADCSGKS